MADIFLPGPAVTQFGTFPAGQNLNVPDSVAGFLALRHGAVAFDKNAAAGSQPLVLAAQKAAAIDSLVSAPWNQQPVSFDAALARVCVFGQFADGGYLCTDQAAANGSFARRLFKLTGNPTEAYTTTVFSQTAALVATQTPPPMATSNSPTLSAL